MRRKKVIIVLPAFNAEKTLEKTFRKIPKGSYDEILLVDDESCDNTAALSKKLGIKTYRNPFNTGYGGNLKKCLLLALEHKADIIIELHPDGEYDPAAIPDALLHIHAGADFVLGNRFSDILSLLKYGMPIWKLIPNKLLSVIYSLLLGVRIHDFHQGFRVYTKKQLDSICFIKNSSSYLFSFEIILQSIFRGLKIHEVPIRVHYSGKKRGARLKDSIIYSLGTCKTLYEFYLAKIGIQNKISKKERIIDENCPICKEKYFLTYLYEVQDFVTHEKFKIRYCHFCLNASTYPSPQNLARYYPREYYTKVRALKHIKKKVSLYFQRRRVNILTRYKKSGSVLDVGAGEGYIGKLLQKENFTYTGIDAPFSKLSNRSIIKTDFLEYSIRKKYDVITFWESLEHMRDPREYLTKSRSLLSDTGLLLVEVPYFTSIERILFGKNWYHISAPRHLFHFTRQGMEHILKLSGFKIEKKYSVFAPEYVLWGFIQSFYNLFRPHDEATRAIFQDKKIPYIFLYGLLSALLLPLAVCIEGTFYLFRASPIVLYVARKGKSYYNFEIANV